MIHKSSWQQENRSHPSEKIKDDLCVVKFRLDVERLHDLELEELPEVELPFGGRVVENLANENVGSEFLNLLRKMRPLIQNLLRMQIIVA